MAGFGRETASMRKALIACVSLLLFALSAPAQIVNGSFEESTPQVNSGFRSFPSGGTITGWELGGTVDLIHSSYWPASAGDRSVDLTGFGAGSVSQTIQTVPGVTYTVTFDMSGNPEGLFLNLPLPSLMTMTVSATGSPTATFEYDVAEFGNTSAMMSGSPGMMYQARAYTFMANEEATVLTFASQMNIFFGPVIDNVAISAVNATVCHLNNGTSARKTLTVGIPALSAHIAHGDTAGPCPAE